MPIYEYHCPKCEKKFEVFIHTTEAKSDSSLTRHCPDCGCLSAKVMSEAAYKMHGRGWRYDHFKKKAVPRELDD